jgi:hypothetical protein
MQDCATGPADLTALTELLSGPEAGRMFHLKHRTIRAGRYSSPNSSQWSTVPLWPHQSPVSYTSALAGLYTLVSSSDRIAQNNKSVQLTDDSGATQSEEILEGGSRGLSYVTQTLLGGSKPAAKLHSARFWKIQNLLKAEAEKEVVCTVRGSGTSVRDGSLRLTRSTALLLDESCRDVEFRNVTISGQFHSFTDAFCGQPMNESLCVWSVCLKGTKYGRCFG